MQTKSREIPDAARRLRGFWGFVAEELRVEYEVPRVTVDEFMYFHRPLVQKTGMEELRLEIGPIAAPESFCSTEPNPAPAVVLHLLEVVREIRRT